ncbi:MAG: 16S rRNA processing protein RimM [Desulfobacteraceae bacterium]|nr:16S rRNA processing protein RimM [Desulfobacteraceae bacterium]
MKGNTLFTIGKVTGVHGLKGNLKVWSYAESIDTFNPGTNVFLKSKDQFEKQYKILTASAYKKGVMLSLEGIDSRNLAQELVDKEILINRNDLPELEEDTYYWQDLLGLDVIDKRRGFIGKIEHIFPTGANDVLVVKQNDQEVLIPIHKSFIESIDIDAQTVKTILPEDY